MNIGPFGVSKFIEILMMYDAALMRYSIINFVELKHLEIDSPTSFENKDLAEKILFELQLPRLEYLILVCGGLLEIVSCLGSR